MRNIRDNIFVLNAVMNTHKKKTDEALDLQVYDVEQCFDSLWLKEVISALYEAGLQNDKLPLLFLENKTAQVAVKTPGGLSERISINNIIMQGSVWGSICCVVLMDKLGKYAYQNKELLYYYKGVVGCPPLQMVDDVLGLQNCLAKSKQLNTVVNTFMELEKLTLSKTKCHKLHIGSNESICPDMIVHGEAVKNSKREKYLGDILSSNGSAKPNLAKRMSRGWGRVSEILGLVKEAPLGYRRITAGLLFRKSLLINTMLFNSEAWHDITDTQIEAFEKIDEALIRGLVSGHSKIPLPALYLETGQVPIRYIIATRRILYLQTILQREPDELIRKVYTAQKDDPSDGDFCQLVIQDCQLIDCQMSNDQIASMDKYSFKVLVKRKAKEAAFRRLMSIKETKSKMENILYLSSFNPQPYILRLPKDQSSLLLALRTRTIRGIRSDYGDMFLDKKCPLPGCSEPDSLPHTLRCRVLLDKVREPSTVSYGDVFSPDLTVQQEAAKRFSLILEARASFENSGQ